VLKALPENEDPGNAFLLIHELIVLDLVSILVYFSAAVENGDARLVRLRDTLGNPGMEENSGTDVGSFLILDPALAGVLDGGPAAHGEAHEACFLRFVRLGNFIEGPFKCGSLVLGLGLRLP